MDALGGAGGRELSPNSKRLDFLLVRAWVGVSKLSSLSLFAPPSASDALEDGGVTERSGALSFRAKSLFIMLACGTLLAAFMRRIASGLRRGP